jgi:cytochrome c oxidase assembly factor CtaG
MSDAVQSIVNEWSLPVWLTLSIVLTGVIYLRGWSAIRRTRPKQFAALRLMSFLAGLTTLWLAIGSPMDGFADALLSAHMVEHLLLMSVVPPLLLLGLPTVPMLRGLPKPFRRYIIGPLLSMPSLRSLGRWAVTPLVAWLAMNVTYLAWHVPTAYDFALQHEIWHDVEHLCFLSTSILFWWCILRPWPTRTHPSNWGILVFLVSADIVNTLLSAFLAFYDRPVYGFYVAHPNSFNLSPLEDQVLGAAIMWVVGSLAFLIPAVVITMRILRPSGLLLEHSYRHSGTNAAAKS